ncbi:MAG: hypothetical protein JWQ04_1209 [Pedosphaera sp.]|nr:hypothetical protein [Pedosphaera sp.]
MTPRRSSRNRKPFLPRRRSGKGKSYWKNPNKIRSIKPLIPQASVNLTKKSKVIYYVHS